jgi:hypothetical protein
MKPIPINERAPEFRQIPGFPNYDIAKDGRVFSRITDRLLRTQKNKLGYPRIRLAPQQGTRQKTLGIHCLVALAWIGPRPPGMHVAHLDGNPSNSHVSNLAYVTLQENIDHMRKHGTRATGERVGGSRLSEGIVRAIFSSTDSASKTAIKYGISKTHVLQIRSGQKWKHLNLKSHE